MGVLNTNVMVFLPLMIFLIEGMMFFNISPLSQYALTLLIIPFPDAPVWSDAYWAVPLIYVALILVWIALLFAWPFIKLFAIISFLGGMLSVPFSLMKAYPDPITIMFHVGLMLMMTFGILFKIKIAGSGVEGQ
jgi:hypothetical protein